MSNQPYQIAVTTYVTSTVQLTLAEEPTPQNDAFTNRTLVLGTTNFILGTTAGASLETNEPVHSTWGGKGSVWYSWLAPVSGQAYLEIESAPPNIIQAAVYQGDTLTNLTRLMPIFVPFIYGNFPVEGGTRYAIAVDTQNLLDAVKGPFSLKLGLAVGPPNDAFAKRIRLIGTTNLFGGNIRYAHYEPGEPLITERSLWWTWTAPTDGLITLSNISPPACHTYFALFTGSTVSNLTML